MLQSKTQINVRYAETDMMGVVYHGSYLPWFEIGRTNLLKEYGVPYRKLEADGYFLPVVEVQARYHRPAVYDDTVTVITTLREKPGIRIELEYEIRRDDTLLVTGKTVHAFIDRQGRPTRPPASFSERMSVLFPATS
ncbi:MAG: thioesterase family protein [Nibricoccus sp.]